MSLDYYNAQLKPWVSPRLVLVYYDRMLATFNGKLFKHEEFRKILEAKASAIALLGVRKLNGNHFMMQVPVGVNESPDIVTMNLREYLDKPVQMEIQDVEVVEYSDNTSQDIATFLIQEKLSPTLSKKAYDDKTIILCHITKKSVVINHPDLHNKIRAVNPRAQVYLLGEMPTPKKHYRLVRVWPNLDSLVEIDVVGEGNSYPRPDACKFSLGTNKKIEFGRGKLPLPTPYEVFELNESDLRKKFC